MTAMTQQELLWNNWPGDVAFVAVSPTLARARLVGLAALGIPLLVIATVLSAVWWGTSWPWIIGGAGSAFLLLRAFVVVRAVRAWGYAERDDDLVIRHGLWTKRLSIVPYGRMQFIDVSASPFERLFGLASVSLHTAAATTDASVPGLEPSTAASLRDRLAERARTEREGL
ncbi:PH domain-containing protein [Stackebrandtia soli]|uniref:PH domain-containing protein n=1 Tax=Stackebrandtia soli TaxID=1892856 RepID=UPI0039ED8C98